MNRYRLGRRTVGEVDDASLIFGDVWVEFGVNAFEVGLGEYSGGSVTCKRGQTVFNTSRCTSRRSHTS